MSCQVALPGAAQSKLNGNDAVRLVRNGCTTIAKGANLPVTPEDGRACLDAGIGFGPGNVNADGVATFAL